MAFGPFHHEDRNMTKVMISGYQLEILPEYNTEFYIQTLSNLLINHKINLTTEYRRNKGK